MEIKEFAFSKAEITIPAGSKVTFINRDEVKHNAVADGGEFETKLLGQDESETVEFDAPGSFSYHCGPHPGMTAKIVVE